MTQGAISPYFPDEMTRARAKESGREKNIPASQYEADSEARLPCPDGHGLGPEDHRCPPGQGTEAARRIDPQEVNRAQRLRRSAEFQRVTQAGQKIYTRNLLVFATAGLSEERRLGITVTRKVGNAVFRNRAKRVTREAFRRTREGLPPGTDVVIIVKRDTAWPSLERYEKDIAHAFRIYTRRARH